MAKKQSDDAPRELLDLDIQMVTGIIAKMAELDEEATKNSTFRLCVYNELLEAVDRIEQLEAHVRIIQSKLDQSNMPSLLTEFIAYTNAKKSAKKPPKKSIKKSVRKKS